MASYGFVSNLTYGTGLAVAWIAFVRQVGKSPLMAGQWKAFLAFYAGNSLLPQTLYSWHALISSSRGMEMFMSPCQFSILVQMVGERGCIETLLFILIAGFWTIQNFVRPLRFSVALAMAPVFERGISAISRATGFSRRNAFGVYLFILGSVTSFLVFGSIFAFAGPLAYARV